jgi:hypothetical protein
MTCQSHTRLVGRRYKPLNQKFNCIPAPLGGNRRDFARDLLAAKLGYGEVVLTLAWIPYAPIGMLAVFLSGILSVYEAGVQGATATGL